MTASADPDSDGVESRWALVAVPLVVSLFSLALLLPWSGFEVPVFARWLAGAALLAVGLRTSLTYREVSIAA